MKVLIALDESPVSIRAAREAVRLFSVSAAEFLVINVATLPAPWVGAAGFGQVAPLAVDPQWLDEVEKSHSHDDEAELMALAADAGVPDADVMLRSGDAVTQICAAAEEQDVDVIVVGSHNKTALRRLFDPSIAAGVVRDTYRPVLVVSGVPPDAR